MKLQGQGGRFPLLQLPAKELDTVKLLWYSNIVILLQVCFILSQ